MFRWDTTHPKKTTGKSASQPGGLLGDRKAAGAGDSTNAKLKQAPNPNPSRKFSRQQAMQCAGTEF